MNRKDLVKKLQKKSPSYSDAEIEDFVSHTFNTMIKVLSESPENRIEIRGFGVFDTLKRPKRKAVNPKTGERLVIDDAYHPHFKMSNLLLKKLNEKK